jgi:hypothetical protein
MADWDLELEEQQDSPPKRKTKSYGGWRSKLKTWRMTFKTKDMAD